MLRRERGLGDVERAAGERQIGGGVEVGALGHGHLNGVVSHIDGFVLRQRVGGAVFILHRDGAHAGILRRGGFQRRSFDAVRRAVVGGAGEVVYQMLRRERGLGDVERFVPREADGIVVACRESTLFEVIRADVVAGGAAKRSRQ